MKMREITGLQGKIRRGVVGIEQLQGMLAFERKCAEPTITMRTLGMFSADLKNREAEAQRELEESKLAAIRNIPIIEELLRGLGASVEIPEPLKPHGDYAGNENVEDRDGFGE